ncbi:hypothetical protein A6M21_07300 [Desulfotomaculum copahuensis]|uniref:Uncharacterized protein n=2 Tax=Desulfotomaculum copahuensis TaxID=1838280 RepID=A0A1B7LGE0_9FIRM|nr:hypothetical protein A6M21_07300 [Desulfotomaculum copahuensis]
MRFFSGGLLCAILAVFLLAAVTPAFADTAVGMKVLPGLGGLYKLNQPLALEVAVDNPGPGFTGTITVVQKGEQPGGRPDLPRVAINADVPANSSKQFRLVIPGELAFTRPVVQLVSGGRALAESRVEGAAVDGANRVILALGRDIAGGGLQAWLSEGPGAQTNLKYLSAAGLPANSLLLGTADVIMINPAAVAALNAQQVHAIKEWVNLGGTLVLFGGAGAGEGGAFAGVSPVLVTGNQMVDGKLGGLRSGGPLAVAAGRLVAGRALVVDDGVPVLARRQLGWGEVVYCGAAAGDLGGSARGVWSALLQNAVPVTGVDHSPPDSVTVPAAGVKNLPLRGFYPVMTQAANQLAGPSAYIPQLAGPPAPVLVLLWLAYTAAVGPLLYYLLRRSGRRDWAWALVPAGALVAAGGFYLFTPAVRIPGCLTQTLSVVDILSPDLAAVRSGASIVAAKGGELTVHVAPGFIAGPAVGYASGASPGLVQENGEQSTVGFGRVQYNSLRQVYAYGLQRNRGSIAGRLYLEGKRIKGDLVNKTGLDLRDCKLILGGRVIQAGSLPARGTLHIDEALAGSGPAPGNEALIAELIGGGGRRPGEPFFRERQMLGAGLRGDSPGPAGIQFTGWHDGAPGLFQVAGKDSRSKDYGLTLVEQAIELNVPAGRFYLPAGLVKPRTGELGYVSTPENGGKVSYGSIPLVYNIGGVLTGKQFKITALDIQYSSGQFDLPVEIYNYREDKWEQLPDGGRRITGAELSRYLSGNEVRLKVAGGSRGPYPVWPGLAVEGVVY